MSVTSVLAGRTTPYRPVSGNNSQSAKLATFAIQSLENPGTQADGAPVTSTRVNGATPGSTVPRDREDTVGAGYTEPTVVSQFESGLADTLRADGTTAARSTSGASESDGSPSSAGIALYKRISQIGSREPSTSELLKSWNTIMQGEQDAGNAGSATLQALLQSAAPAFGSSILDVTA